MHPLDNLKLETVFGVLIFISYGLILSFMGILIFCFGKNVYFGVIVTIIGITLISMVVWIFREYKSKKKTIMKAVKAGFHTKVYWI